jgi:hypothetical protein
MKFPFSTLLEASFLHMRALAMASPKKSVLIQAILYDDLSFFKSTCAVRVGDGNS